MNKLKNIIALVFFFASITCQAKTAILVAHYGSSDSDTRHKTIDLITSDIRDAFPELDVYEAYISPVVRKNLKSSGIDCLSPIEAFDKLHKQGYDTVFVQSSTIIEGAEMADVRKAAADKASLFNEIKVGRPLCYSPQDCIEVIDIMAKVTPTDSVAIVYAGHGNNLPSTATYCQLDFMLHEKGFDKIHVSTIEGYPTVESTIRELQNTPSIKSVELRPLLLVCGNHTKTDIAEDFAGTLNDAGYETSVIYQGFAENPEIRQIYVRRVAELTNIPLRLSYLPR